MEKKADNGNTLFLFELKRLEKWKQIHHSPKSSAFRWWLSVNFPLGNANTAFSNTLESLLLLQPTSITPLLFSTLRPSRLLLHMSGEGFVVLPGAVPVVNEKGFPKSYVEMVRTIVGLCGFIFFYFKLKWILQGVEELSFCF